jgi:hypothetical protein
MLHTKIKAKESPLGIFLFVSEWVATALLPDLFINRAFCSISPLIFEKI